MSMVYECFNFVEITTNMYSEMRGEACDHVRLRNLYFLKIGLSFLSDLCCKTCWKSFWTIQGPFHPIGQRKIIYDNFSA